MLTRLFLRSAGPLIRKRLSGGRRNRLRRRLRSLEKLDERALMAADLSLIDAGLESGYFSELQETINRSALNAPAPLIGNALAGPEASSSSFLSTVGERLRNVAFEEGQEVTTAMVRQQLADALNLDEGSIEVIGRDGDDDIRFRMVVSGTQHNAAVDLNLVGAETEIDLKAGGEDQVDLDLEWTYELTFGVREVDDASEFYMDASRANEVEIRYTATIQHSFSDHQAGQGLVGVLLAEIQAADALSQYQGQYALDVAGDSSGSWVTGRLTGSGQANLEIDAAMFPTFLANGEEGLVNLGVSAQGEVDYDTLVRFDSRGETDFGENRVAVSLRDVTLDMGAVYRDFIDPIVASLQRSLQPVKPAIDLLTAPLPVISDLSVMAGGGPLTALSAAVVTPEFTAADRNRLQRVVNGLDALFDYTGLNAESGEENLFSFRIERSGVDPRTAADRQEAIRNNLQKVSEEGFFLRLADKHQEGADEGWKSELSWKTAFQGALDIPFLTEPEALAGLLLGDESTDLFTFTVDAGFDFDVDVNIPIAPLLNFASVTGGISFDGQLRLGGGYDAAGMRRLIEAADFSSAEALRASLADQQHLLMQGFYLNDHNADAGTNREGHESDAKEVVLNASVSGGVGANLDLVLAQFYAGGSLSLSSDLSLDLNDLPEPESWAGTTPDWSNVRPDQAASDNWVYDGKLRLHELATIVDADPRSLLNASGGLTAGLDASVSFSVLGVPVFSDEFELARMTLMEGVLHQPPDGRVIHGQAPSLGEVSDGVLTLFMGDTASRRANAGDNNDPDESFVIRALGASRGGGESLMVVFQQGDQEYTQFFDGVTEIHGSAGAGQDTIQALTEISSAAFFSGGDGEDVLTYAGLGAATLDGGAGNDVLQGGVGDDVLNGGSGQDRLYGGLGDDELRGGAGDDVLKGDGGDDRLWGDDGADVLRGGVGDDALYGGDGDDQLLGGQGLDHVFGQGGQDRIQVEFGWNVNEDRADVIRGGADRDALEILGSHLNDVILVDQTGPDAFTVIVTATQADGPPATSSSRFELPRLRDENGDAMDGPAGRDIELLRISGLGGDDTISAHGGFDVNELILDGGAGDDVLNGAESPSTLVGGAGDDTLQGGEGDDKLFGGAGDDTLRGGDGSDALYGGAGHDDLNGELGADAAYGGQGNDVLNAGEGPLGDLLYGEDGDDTIQGGDGVDVILGGAGADFLFGGGLGDVISGGAGDDFLSGQAGRDFLDGGAGDDRLYAFSAEQTDDGNHEDPDRTYDRLLRREIELSQQIRTLNEEIASRDEKDPELPDLQDRRTLLSNERAVINSAQQDIDNHQLVIVDILIGGAGNDLLRGSSRPDRLYGGAGDDLIEHTSGADLVFGGDGERDEYRVRGTAGDDVISFEFRERQDDSGEPSTPEIVVSINGAAIAAVNLAEIEVAGADALGGRDQIALNFGYNAAMEVYVDGGDGDDAIELNNFQNTATLRGGEGTDVVRLRLNPDPYALDQNIWLTDHSLRTDQIRHVISDFEQAVLRGNAAHNTLDASGFHGRVAMYGGDGDDQLIVGAGGGELYGGAGRDTVQATGDEELTLDGAVLHVRRGGVLDAHRLESIEAGRLIGGQGDDRLHAGNFTGDVLLDGRGGNDELIGGSGNDHLIGGAGNDQLIGGAGDDLLDGAEGEGHSWIHISVSHDRLHGGAGNDTLLGQYDSLYGEDGDDTLRVHPERMLFGFNLESQGGAGQDIIYGSYFADTLYGGSGNDTLRGLFGDDKLYGGSGDDRLYGDAGNDELHGQTGVDRLYGGEGNDSLYGGVGRDYLYGEDGDDFLDGGQDQTRDYVYGGSGFDVAVQHRRWVYTWGPFGYWRNQESLSSVEWVRNAGW